jgi:hypothetical protein
MNKQINAALHMRSAMGVVGAILLGASAIAVVAAGWHMTAATAAFASDVPPLRSHRFECEECGVIAATRELGPSGGTAGLGGARNVTRSRQDEKSAKGQEVTVRMSDGSSRIFIETTSAHWRPGERIIVIEGEG